MTTNSKKPADQLPSHPWRSAMIFALVIAIALVAHAIGSSSQVEFVYGGL